MLDDTELDDMADTVADELPDTCTVTRSVAGAGNQATLNTATRTLEPPRPTTVYTGKCRIRPAGRRGSQSPEIGGLHATLADAIGTFPLTADIAVDDIVHVPTGSDPTIGRRTFRITSVTRVSYALCRRADLEDQQQP